MSEPPRVTGSPGLKTKPADTRVLSSPNGLEHEQNLFRILYAHTIIFRLCIILSTMQMLLKPLLTCRSRGIERRKRIVYTWCTDAAIGGQTTLLTWGWIQTYKAVIYTGSTPLWPNFLSAEFFITGNYFAAGASMSPLDIRNTFFFSFPEVFASEETWSSESSEWVLKGRMGALVVSPSAIKTNQPYSTASLSCPLWGPRLKGLAVAAGVVSVFSQLAGPVPVMAWVSSADF